MRARIILLTDDGLGTMAVADGILAEHRLAPDRTVVVSIDEKTQIQALGRTRKGQPMNPGRPATMTHDCTRNCTTTLFAALNILDGTVIGRHAERHRHQEFIMLHNEKEAKPFKWTASPDPLVAAHQRGFHMTRTSH